MSELQRDVVSDASTSRAAVSVVRTIPALRNALVTSARLMSRVRAGLLARGEGFE
jgi:hypothetical protein